MREALCRKCGTVNELSKNSWRSQDTLCSYCDSGLFESPKSAIQIPGNGPQKISVSMIRGKGLGVVALVDIEEEELIERCPVMVVDLSSLEGELRMYPYEDGAGSLNLRHLLLPWVVNEHRCIAFGYGTFYNHANQENSNAYYIPYVESESSRRFLDFFARRRIKAGEEITQTYAPDKNLWFRPRR